MKVESEQNMEHFKPVTISITFEKIEEIQEFYAIFNYSRITKLISFIKPVLIRDLIRKINLKYTCGSGDEIFDDIVRKSNADRK